MSKVSLHLVELIRRKRSRQTYGLTNDSTDGRTDDVTFRAYAFDLYEAFFPVNNCCSCSFLLYFIKNTDVFNRINHMMLAQTNKRADGWTTQRLYLSALRGGGER